MTSQEAPDSSSSESSAIGGLVGVTPPPSMVRGISRSYIWVAGEDGKDELSVISACSSPELLDRSFNGDFSDSSAAPSVEPSLVLPDSSYHKLSQNAETLETATGSQSQIFQQDTPGKDESSVCEDGPPDLDERQLSNASSLMLTRSEMEELDRISLSSSCFSHFSEVSLSPIRTTPESDLKKGAPPSPLMMPLSGPSQQPGFRNVVSNAFSREDPSSSVRILRAVSSHGGSGIFEEMVGMDESHLTTPTFARRPEKEQEQEPSENNDSPSSSTWYDTLVSKCNAGWDFIKSFALVQCRIVRDDYKSSPESFRAKVLLGAVGCMMVYKVSSDLIDKLGCVSSYLPAFKEITHVRKKGHSFFCENL